MGNFNVGDVVRLTSWNVDEGITMTVERVENSLVTCIWFDKNGNLNRGSFKEQTLFFVSHS